MKKLLESWKKFLTEEKQTIKTKAELINGLGFYNNTRQHRER